MRRDDDPVLLIHNRMRVVALLEPFCARLHDPTLPVQIPLERRLTGASFSSVRDRRTAIDACNENAHPFQWKATEVPLKPLGNNTLI